MNLENTFRNLVNELTSLYPPRESRHIASRVLEKISGYTPTERILHKSETLSSEQDSRLQQMRQRLLQRIPLQYVLEEAWFMGMPFYVNKAVLIPRPETEELADWILESLRKREGACNVLDIGTGSGCIAVALKKKKPVLSVWALDKYADALEVARKNASELGAQVHFLHHDLMEKIPADAFPLLDVIVSNPPYIPIKEKEEMARHVAGQEPDEALFVPDNDPLIFYKKILEVAISKLRPGGEVFVEINEEMGEKVKMLFEEKLDHVVLKKDLSGKDRMVFGSIKHKAKSARHKAKSTRHKA